MASSLGVDQMNLVQGFKAQMMRKSIPRNVARQLWAQCGGFCQNPCCNRSLFASVDEDVVSLANVAHIIGHGNNGPRTEHDLAEYIEIDGISNLIMLCLFCHKIVDELERKFNVEQMRKWKADHELRINGLFNIPNIGDERELLILVNDLLDENGSIFKEYGPYSPNAVMGESGDAIKIWRKRCLDTILPNNQRIVDLIEKNKRNFSYPWDVYRRMLGYKLHVDAFKDNCLSGLKVNDYKTFPLDFDHFIKDKIGISVPPLEVRTDEELEFRTNQIANYINRFLANHSFIEHMEEANVATLLIKLTDGRELKVFVTNTYFFTEYTFEKVIAVDPEVDAIICSCTAGTYASGAKRMCIENGIGLFMLPEFMGAVRNTGEDFVNYLLRSEKDNRIQTIKNPLQKAGLSHGLSIYLFGSYIRRKIYQDIDIMAVYSNPSAKEDVVKAEEAIRNHFKGQSPLIHTTACSSAEFSTLKFHHDNLTKIYP